MILPEKINKEAKRGNILMTILGFSPAGLLYKAGKGLWNGIVGLGEGAAVLGANLVNNLVQVFKNDSGAPIGDREWLKKLALTYFICLHLVQWMPLTVFLMA